MSLAVPALLTVWAGSLAIEDWRFRRLPNSLLLAGLCFGLVHLVAGGVSPGGAGWLEASLAFLAALAAFLPLHAAGWMGAGDVKFLAVIGWLGGASMLAGALLLGSLLAGALALPLLLRQRVGVSTGGAAGHREGGERLPYGACLALALVPQFWGWWEFATPWS